MPDKQDEGEESLGKLLQQGDSDLQSADSLAKLEAKADDLENRLHEERFMWIFACVVLVDFYVFSTMESWSGPLVIGVLELIGLVVVAKRCNVDVVLPILDRLLGAIQDNTTGRNNKNPDA